MNESIAGHEPIPDSPLSLGARQKGGMTYSPSEECTKRWEFIREITINQGMEALKKMRREAARRRQARDV